MTSKYIFVRKSFLIQKTTTDDKSEKPAKDKVANEKATKDKKGQDAKMEDTSAAETAAAAASAEEYWPVCFIVVHNI